MFSCEFCEISKSTLFYRTPPEAASALLPGFTLAFLVFNMQSRTKLMKQFQEIKQNWTGQETLVSVFCAIFDH